MKTAVIIVNYNMPERTDALAFHIRDNVKADHELIIVDNGSDITPPAESTNLWLEKNVQTTRGWLMGLAYADMLDNFDAYWFLITSAELITPDSLTPMIDHLERNPECVGVHPVLTEDSTTYWEHMKKGGDTWFIDNISSLYRADWFNSIGRFDKDLVYAWGIDLETCYLAREQKKKLFIHSGAVVRKVTDIGYNMNRMNMKASDRAVNATANMEAVLSKKYGSTWRDLLYNLY